MTEHASLIPAFQYLYFVCCYGTVDNSISSKCSICLQQRLMIQPLDSVLGAYKTLGKQPFASEIVCFALKHWIKRYKSYHWARLMDISYIITCLFHILHHSHKVGYGQKAGVGAPGHKTQGKNEAPMLPWLPSSSYMFTYSWSSVSMISFPFLLCGCTQAQIISMDSDVVTSAIREALLGW